MTCTTDIEASLWRQGFAHVAGIDEAGRGALAGPVVAAAVILPPGIVLPGIDDSKKLRPRRREQLFRTICSGALAVSVSTCDAARIDEINILQATLAAMREAAGTLSVAPDFVLIDGNRAFADSPWPLSTIIKGDTRCQSIAAASIVAKVSRDRIMHALHRNFPTYGWLTNVGYPTRAHYAALAAAGPTPHHRRSFRLRAL